MHTCVTCFFRVCYSFMVLQAYHTMPYHTQYDCECRMVLRSVVDEAIQAHLQGKTHKKRMQESEPWQDYECDCGRKLVRVKAFQIKQHCESPACREVRLHILSQNFKAERVQAVPSDFAFEEESNPPRKHTHVLGPQMRLTWRLMTPGLLHARGFAQSNSHQRHSTSCIHLQYTLPGDPKLPAHRLAAGSQRGIQSCM